MTDVCGEGCNQCLDENSEICLDCKDLNSVLHDGKCIAKCPDGFFPNENNHCESILYFYFHNES